MTTLDFSLQISPGSDRTYQVLAHALGGKASATMRLPGTRTDFDRQLAAVRDTVLASSLTAPGAPAVDEQVVRDMGRRLFEQLTVDASVLRARQALRLVKRNTLEWGTPVLYLRAADGRIFDTAVVAPASPGPAHQDRDTPDVETLYDEALAAYWTERWDQAVESLQHVLACRPEHPDAAANLEQARHQQQLAARYRTGLRLLDARQWQQAVDELARLAPGYRDTAALLARARKELSGGPPAPPPQDPTDAVRRPRLVQTVRHGDAVCAVAFSRDGRWLATASHDETARIGDDSGQERLCVRHKGVRSNVRGRPVNVRGRAVKAVAFSPGGRWLATAGDDCTARVWDAGSGQEVATLTHGNRVWSVAFSPDGRQLATASEDYTARVWDARSGQELAVLVHDHQVYGVAFHPDGHRLATASRDKSARIWSLLHDGS